MEKKIFVFYFQTYSISKNRSVYFIFKNYSCKALNWSSVNSFPMSNKSKKFWKAISVRLLVSSAHFWFQTNLHPPEHGYTYT